MIRIYYLFVETDNNAEYVRGTDLIHDALLLGTFDPLIRKLIMDTTPAENDALAALAFSHRLPTQAETDLYNRDVDLTPPDPDTLRVEELLATSPAVISMPEMWELMRLFGKRLGYRLE